MNIKKLEDELEAAKAADEQAYLAYENMNNRHAAEITPLRDAWLDSTKLVARLAMKLELAKEAGNE